MLAASLLSASHAVASVFSPSRGAKLSNSCKKLVAPSRYRYDPYCSSVLPQRCVEMLTTVRTVTSPVQQLAPVLAAPVKVQQPQVPAGPRYAVIKFKHESSTFLAPFRIAAGEIVVVEGDRGENIGVVSEICTQKPSYEVNNTVLRRATDKDREALAAQRQREATVTKATQSLADSLGLHASIEDAEYQFDLNKLTIFVRRSSKNAFVDFRKLQRGLFREFRCRIWCAYMDEVEAAQQGPRTH